MRQDLRAKERTERCTRVQGGWQTQTAYLRHAQCPVADFWHTGCCDAALPAAATASSPVTRFPAIRTCSTVDPRSTISHNPTSGSAAARFSAPATAGTSPRAAITTTTATRTSRSDCALPRPLPPRTPRPNVSRSVVFFVCVCVCLRACERAWACAYPGCAFAYISHAQSCIQS